MHYCKDCHKTFDKSVAYFNHRKIEHPRFSCPDCGKVFGFRKKLIYHLRACPRSRRNKMRSESGSLISFSDYKRLPIFSAKELDIEFEIYMDRKFGKKGTFRNKKMCKFCCKTFTFASDFADHIRDHYKSIPLDATGVKSKFDFMNFMGLKIRETTGTDYSDTDIANKPEIKITDCRVVIIGERCRICYKSFKCRTDLERHNKIYHSPHNRDEVTLVLRIGKEIMARIPLKKRHIRVAKTSCHSNCNQLKFRLDDLDNSLEHSTNNEDGDKGTEDVRPVRDSLLNDRTCDASQDCKLMKGQGDAQSAIPSEKESRTFGLQSELKNTEGNMTLCQGARGREIIGLEVDTADEAQDEYQTKRMAGYELESSGRIYADEFYDSIEFSEPWKEELSNENTSYYSELNLGEGDPACDGENCYCIKTTRPRLTPKKRTAWEQEHDNGMLSDEGGNCLDLSFHESPPIYKYSCDTKYQTDFSFPSDEKSYGFEVKAEDNTETNNNKQDNNFNVNKPLNYKSAIIVKEGRNLLLNRTRFVPYECEDKAFGFHDLEPGEPVDNAMDNYQEVLIKEEVMLDDCTYCVNDIYASLSNCT